MSENKTVSDSINLHTKQYGNLPLFQAFAKDLIPIDKFPNFFYEQFMTARLFQDLIWATTEIFEGPFAAFAKEHRHRDSGHYKWMEHDIAQFNLPPMTANDFFRLEWLQTRIQMARILACCHNASDNDRMVILASLESAGEVTLGTLFEYSMRHKVDSKLKYLGQPHINIENQQNAQIQDVAKDLFQLQEKHYLDLVDLVFDALTIMFSEGGNRYYSDYIKEPENTTTTRN